jgi:glycosyltransferase involved in cell wall biosynthesis
MEILWLDPFHGGSHAAVAAGYAARSAHHVRMLTLSQAGGWRWRMRGGAVTMARMARASALQPDLIVTSDMLDLAVFRALTADRFAGVPIAAYFHENQLTYPLPPGRKRDLSWAWINYTSALVADHVLFNSAFHMRSMLGALPELLGRYHDYQELQTIDQIAAKSRVLPPGIDLSDLKLQPSPVRPQPSRVPILLWNARWEYDKQPAFFFAALEQLAAQGIDFRLIIAGEHIDPQAPDFATARARWATQIIHWGYTPSRAAYCALLQQADIVVSTALQEFFGISIVEALAGNCVPVLPARLNYPDLLPPELHAVCLYWNDVDLAEHLAQTIARLPELRRIDWPALAQPYDWSHQAPAYDTLFSTLSRPSAPLNQIH